nr:capsid protein [Cressdnaviricota sp.]
MPYGYRRTYRRRAATGARKQRNPYRKRSKYVSARKMPMRMAKPIFRSGVPTHLFTKLKYSDIYSLTGTTAPTQQVWRINSLHDPDLTGTGHQPYYYDQLTAMWDAYRVYGAKFEFWFETTTGSENAAVCIRATYNNNPDSSVDISQSMERPNEIVRMLTPQRPTYIKKYFSVASVYGTSKQRVRTDDIFSALVGANPGNVAYLTLSGQTANESSGAIAITARVRITFYAKMFLRSSPAQG